MKSLRLALLVMFISSLALTSCIAAPVLPPDVDEGGSAYMAQNTQIEPQAAPAAAADSSPTDLSAWIWPRQPTVSEETQRLVLENPVLNRLTASFAARRFIEGEVPAYEIEAILLSGARAHSARNQQPWRFTVITEWEDVQRLHRNAAHGNVVIVISGRINHFMPSVEVDAGIAVAYMQIAAESLGLGARILGLAVDVLEEYRGNFDIPEGYRVVIALIVGTASDAVDGFASATPRNPLDNIVNWVP